MKHFHKRLCSIAVLAAMAAVAQPTAAEPAAPPSPAHLRRELASLQAHPPKGVPRETLLSIGYLLDTADRIDGRYSDQAASWRARAARYLADARAGKDPYPLAKGEIVNRAYATPISTRPQGYAIYIPPDYDPSKPWPLYICLHGGSSNGNLFLGVVLGNNMSWKAYPQHLYDDYTPRWSPEFIVVAPTGFGQVMWRWMGEQDVLDVIRDVRRHYNVDPNRIILGGLSNGGVGAYAVGLRHASEFAAVQAMAGAPSWIQYAGGSPRPQELRAMRPWSGMHLAANETDTDFRYYHGLLDGGPMKPAFVRAFTAKLESLGLPHHVKWFHTGHDILYFVHRHGRVYDQLAEIRRNPRPSRVTVVTGDYRAARQHWVTVTRIADYPSIAQVHAKVDGSTLTATTDKVNALAFDLRTAPLAGRRVRIVVDGSVAYHGLRAQLGDVIHLVRSSNGWKPGFPDDHGHDDGTQALVKRPGVSGPIMDAYYGRMVHVYGTRDPAHTAALKAAAEKGAHGWPLWLWDVDQEVVPDTAVDDAMMRSAHLVLYGTAKDNAVLAKIAGKLPIQVTGDAVVVGDQRFAGPDVGVRFIYPNPLAPDHYVIVQAGVTPKAVTEGNNLPDFLPDYVVYDARTTRSRPRITFGSNRPLALGYFDDHWKLPATKTTSLTTPASHPHWAGPYWAGPYEGDPNDGTAPVPSSLPITPPPPSPPRARHFLAPASDPAGRLARIIARKASHFPNLRAEIHGATWKVDPHAVWKIRPEARCLAQLTRLGVPFRTRPPQPEPVPTPVELLGPVDGVWFRSIHDELPLVMSCEMAVRLPALVRVLRRHGVRGVDVASTVRDRPLISFHTMGLGLDLPRFWTGHGWLSVERDFQKTPDRHTCQGPPPADPRARALRGIACDLFATEQFSTVLTPNYNEGHRNHFHLDARPNDPRLYLR